VLTVVHIVEKGDINQKKKAAKEIITRLVCTALSNGKGGCGCRGSRLGSAVEWSRER